MAGAFAEMRIVVDAEASERENARRSWAKCFWMGVMALNIVNGEEEFERGIVLHRAGRLEEAEQLYRQVLRSTLNHAGAMYNLAIIFVARGHYDAAIELLQKAIAISPSSAELYNGMGEAYRLKCEGDKALAYFAKAIELNPQMVSAYNNQGIVDALCGRIVKAVASWEKAIAISEARREGDDQSLMYNNLGNAYLEQGEFEQAIAKHRRACELVPGNSVFSSNLLRDYNHCGDADVKGLVEMHREWWRKHAGHVVRLTGNYARDPGKKLRVGFVSPDFREHSVSYFLTGLFERYDRSGFEFICYGNGGAVDAYTRKMNEWVAGWRHILGMRDEEAARLIQQDGVDILIDLAGHTAGNRLEVFAYKPAAVQVAYLGYPLTTGSELFDWRITDSLADPVGMTEWQFAEKLWRLPRTAWCFRLPVQVESQAMPPVLREAGRPFTFGSFNNYSKVTSQMIAMWCRILRETPGSRMLLKAMALRDEAVCAQVRERFSRHGIGAERLLFSGKQPTTAEHLARYGEVDLALDTFPYDGTTTTCEALWMNVPLVTLEGETHLSRVGVSLLTNAGLGELIAKTPEEYVKLAVGLARDPQKLAGIRAGLREKVKGAAWSDEAGFARDFCEGLRGMWRKYCGV